MKDYKRKDKLLITIIALACLIMTIANPDTYDIRDLAWNYSLMLLLFSAIFWFLSEIGDLWSSYIFRFDAEGNYKGKRHKASDLKDLTREQLMMLAGDVGISREKLEQMTDEEIARLIMASNGVVASSKKTTFMGQVYRLYKVLKFSIISIIIIVLRLRRYIAATIKQLKSGKKVKKRKIWTLKTLEQEREKLMKELGADDGAKT